MIRLSRAGREQAILDALKRLRSEGKHTAFTRGEICKKMGITSQSKIRDILRDMSRRGVIDSGLWLSDVYGHDVEIFSLRPTKQMEISSKFISINGVLCDMETGEPINQHV
jgi:SOS-response transcriptional repressor LexA